MHWRRKWQPTPVFLPGESQGWGSLALTGGRLARCSKGVEGWVGTLPLRHRMEEAQRGELSFHASPHHPRGPALGSEERTPRADLGMSRHVNSISQPWRSGSWRYFLRDSFPGGVADLEDPTHRGRQNNMDRSMLCRRGLVNLISQEHSWLL